MLKRIGDIFERVNKWYEEKHNQLLLVEKFQKGAALLIRELIEYDETHRQNLYYKFNAGDLLNNEKGELLDLWKSFKFKMGECTDAIKHYVKVNLCFFKKNFNVFFYLKS